MTKDQKIQAIKGELNKKGIDPIKNITVFNDMDRLFNPTDLNTNLRKTSGIYNDDQIETIKRTYNKYFPNNQQQGGYLSTPRRRKRNMKSNSTRNFFKFTSKRGVKKANKKSRKKRKN